MHDLRKIYAVNLKTGRPKKNALCRGICNLRSFLNSEITVLYLVNDKFLKIAKFGLSQSSVNIKNYPNLSENISFLVASTLGHFFFQNYASICQPV
jgi:hypothetical protein